MNRTIKLLMISDIFFMTGAGFIEPIIAIFLKENLQGGTIFAVGIASTIFLITKSIVQLPFSRYVDSHDDKIKWLLMGTFLLLTVPLMYIFSSHIYHIYFIQLVHGIGSGLAYPTWLGLWSTNLDKKHESYEWSIYSTLTGLGIAITAVIGAAIADFIGFRPTFIFVFIMYLVGFLILFGLERKKQKLEMVKNLHYHKKRKLIHTKHH